MSPEEWTGTVHREKNILLKRTKSGRVKEDVVSQIKSCTGTTDFDTAQI